VSHDLRAPLRGMQGFAQALREDYADRLDAQANDYLNRISRASRRMESLIEDLLDYSRLSREEFPLQPVSLDSVVDQALAQVIGEVERRSASMTVQRPLPRVLGHQGTLVRVVANLLSNALKFMPQGKTPVVTVAAENRGATVRLRVEDNGIGIQPEHRERVFRLFERLHGVESFPGTGVGLAVVRKGLERLGGNCSVDSEPGRGSRFWIELPEHRESNP
jgi:signal transduction histidine kinase